jgi:hypothetical protein
MVCAGVLALCLPLVLVAAQESQWQRYVVEGVSRAAAHAPPTRPAAACGRTQCGSQSRGSEALPTHPAVLDGGQQHVPVSAWWLDARGQEPALLRRLLAGTWMRWLCASVGWSPSLAIPDPLHNPVALSQRSALVSLVRYN